MPRILVDLNRFLIPSIEGILLKSKEQEMTADKNPCSSSLVISPTYHVSIELDGSKLIKMNNSFFTKVCEHANFVVKWVDQTDQRFDSATLIFS